MECPSCGNPLKKIDYKGMEVDHCSNCGGTWFDQNEIDELEDTVFDQDDSKNTMITNVHASELKCPKCQTQMKKFNYRWEDLELDMCPSGHGFWLDRDEEKQILEYIEEYAENLERKAEVEDEWTNHLKNIQSPSFFDKIKDMF